jgi:hypothetical protein
LYDSIENQGKILFSVNEALFGKFTFNHKKNFGKLFTRCSLKPIQYGGFNSPDDWNVDRHMFGRLVNYQSRVSKSHYIKSSMNKKNDVS